MEVGSVHSHSKGFSFSPPFCKKKGPGNKVGATWSSEEVMLEKMTE